MWGELVAWVLKPKNMIIVILAVLVILAGVYAGVQQIRVAVKDKEIAEQKATAAENRAKVLEKQKEILENNLAEIIKSREQFQKIQRQNESIKSDIANLSLGKDENTDEAKTYKRMFDLFLSNGMLHDVLPTGTDAAGKDKMSGGNAETDKSGSVVPAGESKRGG